MAMRPYRRHFMEERKSGSYIVGEDGKPAPNLSDEAMAQAKKLRDILLRRYAAGKKRLGEETDSTIADRSLVELQIEVETLEARNAQRVTRNESTDALKEEVNSEQQ
jgi:hypothetical protein